jgi:hypothetical protein
MEWKTKVINGRRVKVTPDGRYNLRILGRFFTIRDSKNNNKIIKQCRSYREVEQLLKDLLLKTGE